MNENHESNLIREDDTLDGGAILRLLDKPLTADDLREATARVARPLEKTEQDVARLLLFQVGDELMALESVEVKQVTRVTRVHRIPHRSNKIVRGFCSLDGELMLCADLSKLLELNEAGAAATSDAHSDDDRRLLVLGDAQNRWVVEVDAVLGVSAVVRGTFQRPPITVDAALARYTEHLVPLSCGLAAILDTDRVISGFQAALR